MTKLKGKSNTYKKKRQEQSELRAEVGVLSRTEEILKQRFDQVQQILVRTSMYSPFCIIQRR